MKTKNILTAFVMAAFLVASCAKEATPATQENIHSDTPGQEQGGVVVNPDGTLTLTFTSEATSRTSLASDGKTVDWVAGDAIRFWGGETNYDATAQSSAHNTAFSDITVPEELSALYVTYPANIASECEDGTLYIKFPSTRTAGEFAGTDYSAAQAVKTDGVWNTSLHFKNIASLLQISITDNEITQLSVEGLDGEAMAGTLPVSFDASGNLAFGDVISASTKVNLSVGGAGEYFIPVIPGTVSNGFRVTMLKGSDPLTPFTFVGAYTLAAGQITRLTNIDQHNGQFYVTPSGSGLKGGTGWNNAMSAAQFKAFVENGDNHFLVRGATFHFSADEFTFGDYVQPDFSGHGEVNFTLEGTRSGSAMTTFIGGSGDPAGMLWPKSSTNVTVKNVKFTGTDGNSNRAAIRVNTSSAKLSLDHCVFENNQTSGQSAAINLIKGIATITDCEFTGNSASNGASINAEEATVTISGCTFTGNTGNGNAVYVNSASATLNMQDCNINSGSGTAVYINDADNATLTRVNIKNVSVERTESTAENDFTGGAAIRSASTGTLLVTGGTIQECYSVGLNGGAVALVAAGNFTFNGTTFKGNHTNLGGGAVYTASGGASYNFTDCLFEGNYATGEGGAGDNHHAGAVIYATQGGTVVNFTNTTMKGNYNIVSEDLIYGGIIRFNSSNAKGLFDGCVFDGNYTNRTYSANPACAAIINNRLGTSFYFNACEFKENTSGTGNGGTTYGGTHGMVIWSSGTGLLGMNNCSVHDNYGGRNTDEISWICLDKTGSRFILSNSTVVGDLTRYSGQVRNNWGVIRIKQTGGDYQFLNNIICSKQTDGNCIWFSGATPVTSYYNKTSKEGDGRVNWGDDTGSGHDYTANSTSFGGWDGIYAWNGTMSGTNSGMKAATADVNTAINDADSDFYAWLDSIGALGKDINGNNRGATSWPGCYQN